MSGEPSLPALEPLTDPDDRLAGILTQLDEAAGCVGTPAHSQHEQRLVQARLGMATALFAALRCKHPPTASHSLRVALGCSRWGMALELPEAALDQLEVAALLHDIGKIGVPESVMLKPGKLTASEAMTMNRHRSMGMEIIRNCCASHSVLDIVRYAPAWYSGRRADFDKEGEDLPLGARMVAIVDAFDSMTTDHVYRRALPRERALRELYQYAGTQFDPILVQHFAMLHEGDLGTEDERLGRRWLAELDSQQATDFWDWIRHEPTSGPPAEDSLFQQKLIDNMRDGVVFVDNNLHILLWNHGAERLTGLAKASVCQQHWSPALVGMCDEQGNAISDTDCPVAFVVRSGVQSIRRVRLTDRRGRHVSCDIHVAPVIGSNGITYGANLLIHDASPEASLEERCQNLHERATRDPLTQVANRAEFDRAHKLFVETHLERGLPCSLIMCDIDHFKQINDNYGHQAGDEVIRTFAQLLKQMCRPGDLVARYGGEEFVVLCTDCDNATASGRAEQIRRTLSDLPMQAIESNCITASFGVTEIQPGDTDETMLRRADRGLLMAKDGGRNAVVQLGSGVGEEAPLAPEQITRWWSWLSSPGKADLLLERDLVTPVPLNVAVEKLRGFVADHHATIDGVNGNQVLLRLKGDKLSLLRRAADRPVAFLVELTFAEEQVHLEMGSGLRSADQLRTRVRVTIRPRKQRDRRHRGLHAHARQLLTSVRSYLMASDAEELRDDNVIARSTTIVGTWLRG